MVAQGQRSLVVDFDDMNSFNNNLTLDLLSNPKHFLDLFRSAVVQMLHLSNLTYVQSIPALNIRFRGLNKETSLQNIRAKDIGKLIMTTGTVGKVSEITLRITAAAFRCSNCSEMIFVEQVYPTLEKPSECPSCNNKKKREFLLLPNESDYIEVQNLEIRSKSKKIDAEICDDIVGTVRPGDNLILTASVGAGLKGKTRIASPYLKINYLEIYGVRPSG